MLYEDGVNAQVKEQAGNTLVIIYQHVGDRLRSDLSKKDIHPSKYVSSLYSFVKDFCSAFCLEMYLTFFSYHLSAVPSEVKPKCRSKAKTTTVL